VAVKLLIPVWVIGTVLISMGTVCGMLTVQASALFDREEPILGGAFALLPTVHMGCHLNGIAIECDDLNEYEVDSTPRPIRNSQGGREI
jgi:hypothetical protein